MGMRQVMKIVFLKIHSSVLQRIEFTNERVCRRREKEKIGYEVR